MLNKKLSNEEIESLYDSLSQAIDVVGESLQAKMLCKIVLILANELGESEIAVNAIEIAQRDL